MTELYLFGGAVPWDSSEWTSSDDRVRGGSSQSYLEPSTNKTTACFRGTLDFNTLGGAGFASQRTTKHDDQPWNLNDYDGVRLIVEGGASKKYTFILKDDVQPRRSDGREQSTISWEYTFTSDEAIIPTSAPTSTPASTEVSMSSLSDSSSSTSTRTTNIDIPWSSFAATFRGKDCADPAPIKKAEIRRISIMMRSFFAEQSGPFSLTIHSISAYKSSSSSISTPMSDTTLSTPAHDKQTGTSSSTSTSISYAEAKAKSLHDRGQEALPSYQVSPGYKLQEEKDAVRYEDQREGSAVGWA